LSQPGEPPKSAAQAKFFSIIGVIIAVVGLLLMMGGSGGGLILGGFMAFAGGICALWTFAFHYLPMKAREDEFRAQQANMVRSQAPDEQRRRW
jgi:hypothetical protein